MKVPRHVACVLDGNRRYAKKHHKNMMLGHKAGLDKIGEFLKWCREFKIKEATLYCLSTENFKRPKQEVSYLMNLFRYQLKKFLKDKDIMKHRIKVRFIGNLRLFANDIQNQMLALMEKTKKNDHYTLNLALGYGSKAEIIESIKKIIKNFNDKKLKIENIDENELSKHLQLPNDVDLFIRPGGEKRLSNFLLWQSSYAELYFSDKLWPEFTKQDFKDALEEYAKRERRFGG